MKNYLFIKLRLLLCGLLIILLPDILYGQEKTINGTIVDENGITLPGVTVVIKGTTKGVSTDNDGKFSITAKPGDILNISAVGMQTANITVGTESSIHVVMQYSVSEIEDVVVVGYGRQTVESVVGAISYVSGERLQNTKQGGNFEASLQGLMPGVTSFTTAERPGQPNSVIEIRASTSMVNNRPLLIVDGVEVANISEIDPSTVESISVLKDASATAVYGVKGANGVILITTKRGREGVLKLNFLSETTRKEATRLPEMLSAYETLKLRNIAFRNDGLWNRIVSDDVLEHYRTGDSPYLYPQLDWYSVLFKPAYDQFYNLNASGGNKILKFFSSISYLTEGDIINNKYLSDNVFPYDIGTEYLNNKYNFLNNFDFNLTKSTLLSIQLSGYIKKFQNPGNSGDRTYTQELFIPAATSMIFYPKEALEQFPDNVIPYDQGQRIFEDPLEKTGYYTDIFTWLGGRNVTERTSSEFSPTIKLAQKLDFITEGLSMEAQYSYRSTQTYTAEHYIAAVYAYYLNPADSTWGRYDRTFNRLDNNTPQPLLSLSPKNLQVASRSYYFKVQPSYNRIFGNHSIDWTGVFSRRKSRGIADFPSYEESWASRINYNYDRKYFIEASVAHTGSEKFAQGLRFGTFPAFAGGWIISNEDFFRSKLSWINNLKVKYSWGMIGSDAGIARWLYQTEYKPSNGSIGFGDPLQSYNIIGEGPIPIYDATWETAIKQNLGLEMRFLDNLVSLNIDLYAEERKDILQPRQSIPSWMGVSGTINANLGRTKAHGIETSITLDKTFSNGLNLYLRGNMSMNESRVISWDEAPSIPFYQKREGKPIDVAQNFNSRLGIEVLDYYQNFDELFMLPIAAGTSKPRLGDHQYLDYNADGKVDAKDAIVAASPFKPTFTWSSSLGFNFKKWWAEITFYGIGDAVYSVGGGSWFLYPFAVDKNNANERHLDYWTPENRDATYPSLSAIADVNNYNARASSFSLINAKYTRLRNISLGYQFQSDALNKLGVSEIDLSLVGSNLFTWTDMLLGGDPEGGNWGAQSYTMYPISKRYTLKLQVAF